MKFIAIKTDDGTIKGKLAFYCRMLHVSRQGFYKYLSVKDRPWKYQTLADTMLEIHAEDVCNDTYGRVRMFQALTLKRPDGIPIPSERTVYRVMEKIGLSHRPKRNPKGITKADREARKSDDLLKRNFTSEKPLEKCVTDITEIKAKDGKLYVSAIFDCFDSAVLGLAMETTMKATLCQHTVENAFIAYPEIQGAVLHSDRGSQYTSELYRSTLRKYEIIQSMNSAGGRCHDNARCESMWARLKTELLYDRYNSENLTVSELKSLIWRYFISYWNNRRICTTNGGLPPMLKRQRYYDSLRISSIVHDVLEKNVSTNLDNIKTYLQIVKKNGINDCSCDRYFSQPDCDIGWDSSRDCFYHGYDLYMLVDSQSDLPVFPHYSYASKHDSHGFLQAFFRMRVIPSGLQSIKSSFGILRTMPCLTINTSNGKTSLHLLI
mgnify:CR=1 FL=1